MSNKKYSLTFPEHNIYLLDKFNENTSINVIMGLLKIESKFDENICTDVINKLIELNDALRIKIHEDKDEVYQTIEEYNYEDIECIDMIGQTNEAVYECFKKLVSIPFVLTNSKLYDIKMLRYNENSGYIIVKLHHVISDAWTCGQIAHQLFEMYNKCLNDIKIDSIIPSYVEFIESENNYKLSEKYIKDENYWREYLKDIKSPISLKTTTSKISTKADRYSVKLDKDINDKIIQYIKNNKVSLYTLFLGALSTYIYRIKDENDIVIGTPILNRSNFREKQMLGSFVSTMAARIKVEENIKFIDLVKDIGKDTMSSFRHQKYPITKTLEYIHSTTDIKGSIYNILLSYQNAKSNIQLDEGFSTDWVFSGHIQGDLQIHILDTDNEGILSINYDYLNELFDKIEIEYLHTRLMAIIENAINDIDVNVENIRIMSKEEENMILYEFNDTDTDYPKDKTVIELFEEQVNKTPDSIALVFEDKQLTYRELNEKANQLAHYLREEKGVKSNDIIALMLDKSIDMMVCIIAILKCESSYVPIDKNFPEDRKEYIIADTKCVLVITDYFDKVCHYININDIEYSNMRNYNFQKSNEYNYDSIVYIMYTSGTTGKPKGVMVTNKNIIRLVKDTNYIDFSPNDKILQTGSVVFDACTFEYWGSLLNGIQLHFICKEELLNPKILQNHIINKNITIMWLTAPLFNQIVEYNSDMFKNIRVLLVGGDVLSVKHINKVMDSSPNINIINGYGPTENTTFSTTFSIDRKYKKTIPIGKPIANSKCYIVDKAGRILPKFVEGELLVSGDGVSKGYINNKKLTKESFVSNKFINAPILYKTGDIAEWLNDGNIKFIGRKDNQVKIRGYRIELDEIKNKILDYKGINDCVVIMDVLGTSKIIKAYYTSNDKIYKQNIIKYLKYKLPMYMIPTYIYQISSIPLNQNGKIDKSKLPKIIVNKNFKDAISVEEKLLQECICKILNIDKISIEDDLIENGLDSLKTISLVIHIKKLFKKEISYKEIFDLRNISNICELLNSIPETNEDLDIKEMEYYPLAYAQIGILSDCLKEKETTNYNISGTINFGFKYTLQELKLAINKVVINNKSLFFQICIVNDNYKQKIVFNKNYSVEISDDFTVTKFDLVNSHLFRIKLFEFKDGIKVFFDFHHIIFDGHSLIKFFEEIQNELENKSNDYENIDYGQATIISKQNDSNYDVDKKYFIEKFSEKSTYLTLYEKNTKIKPESNEFIYNINKGLYRELQTFSKNNSITVGNLLLAAFSILLSKYTYNLDIIFGTAINNRKHEYESKIKGMFVNIFPLLIELKENMKVSELLYKIKSEISGIVEHSSYKYEELIKDLNVVRENDKNPIFDIMFICQSLDFNKVNLDIEFILNKKPKMGIIFESIELDNKLILRCEYDNSKYNEEYINSFFANYVKILTQITVKENVEDLKLVDKIIMEDLEISENIVQRFESIVKKYSNEVAVYTNKSTLTYNELDKLSSRIANYLIKNNIVGNIGICMNRDEKMIAVILGIIKSGNCYIPIDKEYPTDRKNSIIENGDVIYVITDDKKLNKSLMYEDLLKENSIYTKPKICNSKLAYIIFTSGTTGNPKAVMIRHKNIINYVDSVKKFMGNYKMNLGVTTICFDISVFEIFSSILLGRSLCLASETEQKDNIKLLEFIEKFKIERIMTTPSRMKLLLLQQGCKKYLETVKEIDLGGEPLTKELLNSVKTKLDVSIFNCYGPTETTVYSTFANLTNEDEITVGRAINNTGIYILDRFNQVLPEKFKGEIAISGSGLSKGYYNNSNLTNKLFIDIDNIRMYKTGDLGGIDDNLLCYGRIDNQVKIRGFRVELDEINEQVLKSKLVTESITMVKDEKIVVYYVSNKENIKKDLEMFLKNKLTKYMLPSFYIRLDKIPLTFNGKIDKSELYKIKLENSAKKTNEKLTLLETKLYLLFKQVLKKENISKYDSFFEIGGDSLLAMEFVIAAINRGVIIEYKDIFNYPTIRELSIFLEQKKHESKLDNEIKKLDFESIDNLLNKQNFSENYGKEKLGNVLLIGVTGFLGIHILAQMLEKNNNKIYCLVRGKKPLDRFKERLKYYFEDKYDYLIDQRVIIISGDFTTYEGFGEIQNDITTVINAGALVKHFGSYDEFYNANVLSLQKLIESCIKYDKELIHISTTSVSGDFLNRGNYTNYRNYDEKKLYIGQSLENNYVFTKFMGEYYILDAIVNSKLKAKIMRVGNLMGRYTDGKFQINVEDNAFIMRIKMLNKLKAVPINLVDSLVEFTPIDACAEAIYNVAMLKSNCIVYHLSDTNYINARKILALFKQMNILSIENFNKKVLNESKQNLADNKYLYELVLDIEKNGKLDYSGDIMVTSDYTNNLLLTTGYKWPIIDIKYIKKFFGVLINMKYLEGDNIYE